MIKRFLIYSALIYVLSVGSAFSQSQKNYCVTCKGPEQTYRCQISSNLVGINPSAEKLYCAVTISKDKNHETCATHNTDQAQCAGIPVTYSYNSNVPSSLLKYAKPQNSKPPLYKDELQKQDDTPKTLVDLTDQTLEDTRSGLNEAGKAVTDAAKKTYDCVTTLFTGC
ncbi:MAG: hypothetical protein AAF228_09455 [Pseudomonadota bacterium]